MQQPRHLRGLAQITECAHRYPVDHAPPFGSACARETMHRLRWRCCRRSKLSIFSVFAEFSGMLPKPQQKAAATLLGELQLHQPCDPILSFFLSLEQPGCLATHVRNRPFPDAPTGKMQQSGARQIPPDPLFCLSLRPICPSVLRPPSCWGHATSPRGLGGRLRRPLTLHND